MSEPMVKAKIVRISRYNKKEYSKDEYIELEYKDWEDNISEIYYHMPTENDNKHYVDVIFKAGHTLRLFNPTEVSF